MSNAFLLEDAQKIDLQPTDLYDRIINLKLYIGKKGNGIVSENQAELYKVFVIRSDFELIKVGKTLKETFSPASKIESGHIIRKCQMKPDIKVQYVQVNAENAINIDIFIGNFYMVDAKGKTLMSFNSADMQLLGVDIQMGYWGQFKNLLNSTSSMNDFCTFKELYGVDTLSVSNIISVTTESLPPNYSLHIKGTIGTNNTAVDDGFVKPKTFKEAQLTGQLSKQTDLDNILYENITRRFTRTGMLNRALTSVLWAGAIKDPVMLGLDIKNGKLSTIDAEKYGVKVFLSSGAKSHKIKPLLDSDSNPIDQSAYFSSGKTLKNTLNRILATVDADVLYRVMNRGDILVFTRDEINDIDKLSQEFQQYISNAMIKQWKRQLPAVKNITLNETPMIVCPYFGFLEPFQSFEFKSRYFLTTLTTYQAGLNTETLHFTALRCSVSFATVEDINDMQIMTKGD